MAKRTDPETIDTILRLYDEGRSYAKIAEQTGVSKSTVRDIIKAGSKGADKGADGAEINEIPARAHARNKVSADETPRGADKGADTSAPPSAPITKDETIKQLRTLLKASAAGFKKAHESDMPPDKKVWAETQYLKMMDKAIGKMMTCAGLDKGLAEEPDVSALAEFSQSLEEYKDDPEAPQ